MSGVLFEPLDFSYYNVLRINALFSDAEPNEPALLVGYVNSFAETVTTTVIRKIYEGVERKTRAKGSGSGTITAEIHMMYDVFAKSYGMNFDDLREGVRAYGQNSRHVPFTMTALIENEDGERLLRAYPQIIATTGFTRTSTNNTEEVATLSIEYSFMPDVYGHGLYEAMLNDMTDLTTDVEKDAFVEEWITGWKRELVEVVTP